MKPALQAHVKPPAVLLHVAFGEQLSVLAVHSLTSVAHVAPVQAAGQAHEKALERLLHVPPFWHGLDAHSLTSTQLVVPVPVVPGGQLPQV
jgi:hypothetical protein